MPDSTVDPHTPLLALKGVRQSYRKSHDSALLVLDNVNVSLARREIVGLLGRSGSGKSTLLRIAAGLIRPTAGAVTFDGRPVMGPTQGIAMVFQTFAMFPWLTVLENVEIGLEALDLSADEMRKRALAAIDLIGLDGYESAYPKELSGGMLQRVGFARAIVVHPTVLLMDEPFSALDVLTAETLRTDFLDLWCERRLPTEAVLMVTHNIEETVLMCDRVLLFASNPGHVASELRIALPHPRNRHSPTFRRIVDDIYQRMTARTVDAAQQAGGGTGLGLELIDVSSNLLAGLMEALAGEPYRGHADLPAIAGSLQMEIDDLFPIAESLQLLRFADLVQGDIRLTPAGQRFVEADVDARKRQFAEHLLANVPLARHIRRVLDERPSHRAPFARFREELEDYMSERFAEKTLRAAINWGRYAEIFAYDEDDGALSLDNPR